MAASEEHTAKLTFRKYNDGDHTWNDFKKDKPLITGSANDMIYSISILLFVLLAAFYDPLWRPFLHYYFPDSIPLLDYQPYTP